MTDFRHWLRDLNGRRVTADDIAHKLGVSRTTVTRRLVNDELTADELITLANAYEMNPLQALVDLGRITDQQVWAYLESGGQLVETAEDGALALELARRLNPATIAPELDMLAARRAEKSNDRVPPRPEVADNETPLDSVAYSGEDEDSLRRKEEGDLD